MKLPVFVCAKKESWMQDFEFTAWSQDMTSAGYTLIAETEIEFAEPDRAALISGAVHLLREEQKKIRAEAELRFQQIEQHIGELLCLESKPEPELL